MSDTPRPDMCTRRRRRRGRRLLAAAATAAAVVTGLGMAPAGAAESDVHAFGAADAGGPGILALAPVTAVTAAPGGGYWLVGEDGAVYAHAGAPFHGSAEQYGTRVADLAPTPGGRGYWLASSDGGVFSFGNARFHGSLGGIDLAAPVVAMLATPTGQGYRLFTADGGVFSFGDARFRGSAAGLLHKAFVIAAAPTPSGNGYWLAATDGAVYAFGDARFHGSAYGLSSRPVTGMDATRSGDGYWLVDDAGSVFAFGGAPFRGTTAGTNGLDPVVDVAGTATDGYWLATGEAPEPPPYVAAGGVWAALRNCESGGNYGAATGNGFYGAYQFTLSTWQSLGTGYPYPHIAPPAVQDAAAQRLQARAGWGQWPHCSSALGLR